MKALISPTQQDFVVEVVNDNLIFDVSAPLYWQDCPDNILAYQYQYIENQYVYYVPPPSTADENKATAVTLLQQTDWTSVSDVGNPSLSNPYLANQSEFIAWRSQVRAIAVNPIAGNLDIFNQIPAEDWKTV